VQIEGVLGREYELRKHDILTVRSNGNRQLIGRCILASDVDAKTSHSGFTIRIRITAPGVHPIFLVRFLKSEKIRKMLIESGDGANISSLNQKALTALPIAYPSEIRQLEIVARLREIEEETSRLTSVYRSKLAAIAELKQSLLQKAFSGQLTSTQSLAA
jgi:type I restriction enzyme S subunit